MRTIVHLSDLHFGTESPGLAASVIEDLIRLAPSLVVVSGDLTQRARHEEFQAAARFLSDIPFPRLVVPGNHDVPLYDVFRRFVWPFARYQKYIQEELDPWFVDEEMAVLGLNTARSLTWKSGRISWEQMALIRQRFRGLDRQQFRVLVTHHPFIPPPDEPASGIDLVGRADHAMRVLDECRVDLLLAGHLHHGYTGEVRTFYPATRHSIIVVQAGTAISRRLRGSPNVHNHLTLDQDRLSMGVRVWDGHQFQKQDLASYRLVEQEWRRES